MATKQSTNDMYAPKIHHAKTYLHPYESGTSGNS